ncbi:hypothetical protein [Demequina zhanjiangensis]|uniref:LPXTG-motif cell wall anchor domain-containing protein n=1 Tax=Demequina zhanjiangensis TaxID=3051659 RepID=A0ABT8G0U9_9MICO|nr:hypothetical protein [Demequina sp. SYSU T00b26]MDN4472713.1 hypothetical protein [Demequina sp. SYSU T00b26]
MTAFAPSPDHVRIVVFDSDALNDSALARLAPGVHEVVVAGPEGSGRDFAARWRAAGGRGDPIASAVASDLRRAVLVAAEHEAVVVAAPMPERPLAALSAAIQGAAQSVSKGLPAVGIHFMRPEVRRGAVAVISQTGAASGYSALFGAAFASVHGLPLDRVLTELGVENRRHADALDQAIEILGGTEGLPTVVTDDPIGHVSQGSYALAVHAILDVADKHRLLRPEELRIAPESHPNVSAVMRMMDEFPGDIVAVLDAVRLLHGENKALHTVAAVAAGVSVMIGVGAMAAEPAAAATLAPSVPVEAPAASATLTVEVTGPSTLRVTNPTDEDVQVVVHLAGQHGHGGSTYDAGTRTLPSVGAHVSGQTLQLKDFSHDWGHNLYAVQYDFLVDGHVVLVVETPGGVAPTGTTVAEPVPGVVIPTAEPTEQPTAVVTPEPTPVNTPGMAPDVPVATPTPHGDQVPTATATDPTPDLAPHQVPPKTPPTVGDQTPTLHPTDPTPDLAPHQVPPKTPPTVGDQTPTLNPTDPTPDLAPHQVPPKTPPTVGDQTPTLQPSLPTDQEVPSLQQTAVPTPTGGEVPQLVPGQPVDQAVPDLQQTAVPTPTGDQVPAHTPTHAPTTGQTSTDGTGQTPAPTGQTGGSTDGATPGSATGQPPAGRLASTGADGATLMAGLAAAMLAAGAGLTVAARRREDGEEEVEA